MLKRLVVLIFVMGVIAGCDSQSSDARLHDELPVSLFFWPEGWLDWQLDVWDVSQDGDDIFGAGFGYLCKLQKEGVEVGGIKLNLYVTEHLDPSGYGYDIWDATAPNGEKYGFVSSIPSGTWDYDEGKGTARTCPDGEVVFFVGLGNPGASGPGYENELDFGYEWPDTVCSLVNIKVEMPKYSGSLETAGSMSFLRVPYQNFWGENGVIVTSQSFLNGGMAASGGLETEGGPSKFNKAKELRLRGSVDMNDVPEWDFTTEESGGGGLYGYSQGLWHQRVCVGGVWQWIQPEILVPLWLADPCDPNDATDLVSWCEPYSFFAEVYTSEAFFANSESHTVLVVAKDSEGNEVAQLPVKMHVATRYYPNILFRSGWIIPMEFLMEQGVYVDYWGSAVVAIYVPEYGHLEIQVDEFYGDFNFDGVVDFRDYALLVNQLNKNVWDYDDVDLMFDVTRDGYVNFDDLTIFIENWLNEREPVL